MADNTTLNSGTGGDVIGSDDIAGVKFQRVKLIHGADGVNAGDVATTNPLPVTHIDTTASGSITAISQSVALAVDGKSGVALQITGTWVGTLQFEGTVDGTNWVTINGVVAGASIPGSTTTTNGIVRLTPSGLAQVRVTSTAWTSGTAAISFRGSDATGGTFLNQSLTAGTNLIGKVGIDQTTPGTTNLVSLTAETTKIIGTINISAGQSISAISPSLVSTVNSSTVALGISAVFTGTSEQVQDFATIQVSVFSDQASAASGLSVQQSSNGTNWDVTDNYSVPASSGKIFSFVPAARFFRIVYTNGAVAQTVFRLQVVHHYNYTKGSTHSLAETITLQNDAELGISQIRGLNGANALPLLCDGSGNLQTAIVSGTNLIGTVALVDGLKTTYTASVLNLASGATPTDIFTLTGSATKTIRITFFALSAQQTTAGQTNVVILRRSTANTVGTSTAVTAVAMDSANAAATATCLAYTANPTTGTLTGNLYTGKIFIGASASNSKEVLLDYGTRNSQSVVLRGVNQVFAVNLAGVAVTGGSFNITVEWTEE